MKHIKKLSSGFSLIEMLVVIVVFSILAYFVTQSTLQSFVGTRKADAQSKVRDNLNYAASVVERNLRNAKVLTSSCSGTAGQIDYIDVLGNNGRFYCDLNSGFVASGSANVPLTSNEVLVTACSFTCAQTQYNPPVIDFQLVGRENVGDGSEQSLISLSRRIVLRVY